MVCLYEGLCRAFDMDVCPKPEWRNWHHSEDNSSEGMDLLLDQVIP